MKKIGVLIATVILMMLFVVSANALESTGQCGDNVYWNFDEGTGELVISGEGEMKDYLYNCSPFYNSDIKTIVIEEDVTSIGNYAFYWCLKLENITIPESVVNIGEYALYNCSSLKNISIHDKVSNIGTNAMTRCYGISSITVDENNLWYSSDESGVLFNKEKTLLIQYSLGNTRDKYIIPDTVVGICDESFRCAKNLIDIIIPNSVTVIGNAAFQECKNIKSIIIPSSVTTILAQPFLNCDSLTSIMVDVNNKAFSSDEYGVLFNKTKTELLQFPCAKECSLYAIPNSVQEIALRAFSDCSKLKSVSLPAGIVKIDDFMFDNCMELTSVIIPNSVTSIGRQAFHNCKMLSSVNIPNSITTIDDLAFSACYNLSDVFYSGLEEQWKKINIGIYNEYLTEANIHYHYNNHKYETVITNPTCSTQGYTTYTCECGDTYIADYVDEYGHSFTNYISDGKATCSTNGLEIAKCDNCDATDSIVISGDHSFSDEWTIDIDPTCKEEGMKSHHCKYCPAKKDITAIGKLTHNFVSVRVEPSCLDEGYIMSLCYNCGEEKTETIEPTGHDYDDSKCKICDYDRADDCSCNCHKGGIMGFFWKIINFFNKLFKSKQYCGCGAKHW